MKATKEASGRSGIETKGQLTTPVYCGDVPRVLREANQVIKYMHTIDGRPAMWGENQIVFPSFHGAVVLENSLRTVRRQQLKTEEFRVRNKFDHDPDRYGYVRVKV